MEAFDSALISEPQRQLLNAVYLEFRRIGDWPTCWRIERNLDDALEMAGGLAEVCRQLGDDLIVCEPVVQYDARVRLRLHGLSMIPAAAADLEAFLALCRFAAHTYRHAELPPVQITSAAFASTQGVDETTVRRAFQIALLDGRFWASGSVEMLQLNHFASRLLNVRSIAEFDNQWQVYQERHFRGADFGTRDEMRPATRSNQRFFLSHAVADADIAQYLASLIHAADSRVKVFVSSLPGNIQTGDDWLATVRSELRGADAYILLLSRRSIERRWVWFETGAAWFSERRVLPVALPDLPKANVPSPINAHQILSLGNIRETEQFFTDLGVATPDPAAVVAALRILCERIDQTAHTDESSRVS